MTPCVSETFDAIVIGSGVGGLSCAALLGMFGKKVLVLERNAPGECKNTQTLIQGSETKQIPIPTDVGGCMQSISYRDWTWNLGLQYQAPFSCYVGPFYMREAELIPLMTDPPVVLTDLDEAYQYLTFPEFGDNATYQIFSDGQKMKTSLMEKFPTQASAVERYFDYIETTDRYTYLIMITKVLPPALASFFYPAITRKLETLLDKNYDQIVDELFDHSDEGKKVRAILNAYWNVLGMPPNINFLFWTMSDNQLFHGISVPKGGSDSIVKGLLGTIKNNGGELRTGSAGTVKEILIERRRTKGVRLEDGTVIEADVVVSTAGLPDTVGPLVSKSEVSCRVKKTLKEHISVPSSLILRIGLDIKRDQLAAMKIVEKTTYRQVTGRPWEFNSDPTKEGWEPDDVMVLFPKYYYTDPGDSDLQTVEVVHITDYQKYFSKYSGPEDPAFKEAEARIIDVLRSHFVTKFPALADHIACMMLTSPLTLPDQIHHKASSMYGIDAYRTIDPTVQSRTGVKGFYMSGEDTFVNGVTVATGIITASCIIMDECIRATPKLIGGLILDLPGLIIDAIKGNPKLKLPDEVRRMLTGQP